MNEDKNTLIRLGEWWEQRPRRHPRRKALDAPAGRSPWLPSPGSALFTLLVVGGLLWAQSAGAIPLLAPAGDTTASTGTVAYQGRLADPDGTPLTGTYPMIFRLYAQSAGGTPLWEEQWTGPNSVAVSDGLFNVMLGSLNAIPWLSPGARGRPSLTSLPELTPSARCLPCRRPPTSAGSGCGKSPSCNSTEDRVAARVDGCPPSAYTDPAIPRHGRGRKRHDQPS